MKRSDENASSNYCTGILILLAVCLLSIFTSATLKTDHVKEYRFINKLNERAGAGHSSLVHPGKETSIAAPLTSVSCDFLKDLELSDNIECGQIEVLENHADPQSRKLLISYIVLKAIGNLQGEYPMIHLTGGPGGSGLTKGRISSWFNHPILETRDIILLDQRGIGYSSALPNMHEELFEVIAKNASPEEEVRMIANVTDLYKKKCTDLNRNLEFYNSFQNAKDIGVLMRHLDYKKYNLYGTSYGTRLARIVQDMFPALLHSVILNSPAPLSGDMLTDRLKSYSTALDRVIDACKNDNECANKYPDLKNNYLHALSSIQKEPILVTVNGSPFYINVQDAVYFLRRKLYGNDSRIEVPALISSYLNGNADMLKATINNEFGPNYNYSMWMAVERYEQYSLNNNSSIIKKEYAKYPLLPVQLGLFHSVYLSMKKWHNAILPKNKKSFQQSAIPTIIMVNQYDPVTPPEYGHLFMKDLSHGQLFILDEGGHGGGDALCRNKVMIEFMNAPNGKLDADCFNLYKK